MVAQLVTWHAPTDVALMVAAAKEHRAHAIGMSGLLVKSTVVMKDNLAELNSAKQQETAASEAKEIGPTLI